MIIGLETKFVVFLKVAVLHRLYCSNRGTLKFITKISTCIDSFRSVTAVNYQCYAEYFIYYTPPPLFYPVNLHHTSNKHLFINRVENSVDPDHMASSETS